MKIAGSIIYKIWNIHYMEYTLYGIYIIWNIHYMEYTLYGK